MEKTAEELYAHRDELAGDEVPVEHVRKVRLVVSVRFNRGALDEIATAARVTQLSMPIEANRLSRTVNATMRSG